MRLQSTSSPRRPIRSGLQTLRRLIRNEAGIGVVGFGLAMPAVLGLSGLGVEVGLWYKQKHDLQLAADAGAIAAAYELVRSNEAGIMAAALAQAKKNGFLPSEGSINVVPNTAGGVGSVAVQLNRQVPRLLSSLFLDADITIAAASTASVTVTGDACVLALDPLLDKALDIQGSTILEMPSCTLASNSASVSSVAVSGSATLSAASLWAHGGTDIGGSANVTLPGGRLDHMWVIADPYADLEIPGIGSCAFTNKSYSNVTIMIDPGVYCDGLSFGSQAVVTLNPGIYYVLDGDLTFGAQAKIRCNCTGMQGVTFVLTTKGSNLAKIGKVRMNGGSDVQVVAPSDPTHPFVGVLIYQDRRATSTQANKLNGGSNMTLTGAIYAPAQPAEWSGNNGSATASCTRLIARSITFIGNSFFNNAGCAEMGVKPIEVTSIRVSS